jgi:hypothetical protein
MKSIQFPKFPVQWFHSIKTAYTQNKAALSTARKRQVCTSQPDSTWVQTLLKRQETLNPREAVRPSAKQETPAVHEPPRLPTVHKLIRIVSSRSVSILFSHLCRASCSVMRQTSGLCSSVYTTMLCWLCIYYSGTTCFDLSRSTSSTVYVETFRYHWWHMINIVFNCLFSFFGLF